MALIARYDFTDEQIAEFYRSMFEELDKRMQSTHPDVAEKYFRYKLQEIEFKRNLKEDRIGFDGRSFKEAMELFIYVINDERFTKMEEDGGLESLLGWSSDKKWIEFASAVIIASRSRKS